MSLAHNFRWYTVHAVTHRGRVTHICIGSSTIIDSDNGLSPRQRQAIIWTSAGMLSIWPSRTKFSEILIGIQTFSFKKMHLKMSSAKWRLGLNVLINAHGLVMLFVHYPEIHVIYLPISVIFLTRHQAIIWTSAGILLIWPPGTNFSEILIRIQTFSFKKMHLKWRPICLGLDVSKYGRGMMTSSNGNIFRVTGLLCEEFPGHRWIPHTKASDAELWCFLWSRQLSK